MRKSTTRSTRSPEVLDLSIHGDELEQHRIQLENNLQRTDLSLHLSSNDEYANADSVEYPRHTSGPSPFPEFGSFINRSGELYDGDTHNAWSYRTGDDEEGINPYIGQTMSTAAHHASALTLTAGLGGRGTRRDREVSLSGAEYDPDRPLRDMLGAADSKLSIFDMDPSRSKYSAPGVMSLDPLVVNSTAELDRVLPSGNTSLRPQNSRSVRLRSPHSSQTSSAGSDSDTSISRPKLSDALQRVPFSPKRPRNTSPRVRSAPLPSSSLNPPATKNSARISSPLSQTQPIDEQNVPTPRPARRTTAQPTTSRAPPSSTHQPEVRLHPPTPSSSRSQFTKMARGLARELDNEVEKSRRHAAIAEERNPFDERQQQQQQQQQQRNATAGPQRGMTPLRNQAHSKSRIHLPDITGLTNAVESPARGLQSRYPYPPDKENKEVEAQIRSTLSAVQAKLRALEDENSISRRRMRELEHELEMCKKEVIRERTRVLEREDDIVHMHRNAKVAGKQRARDRSANISMDRSVRYKEVVEEKKALEALITTLRGHLTRLTAELSSHQELLLELRSSRESDSRAMKDKSAEVQQLREEVERLAGEVEVLRGVVEDGLRERRAAREASELFERGNETEEHEAVAEEEEEEEQVDEDEEDAEPFDPQSIPGSSRDNFGGPDRTLRTDRATLGSGNASANVSQPAPGPPATASDAAQRFIEDEEFERISAEVTERRLERSRSNSVESVSVGSQSHLQSYFVSGEHSREDMSPTPPPAKPPSRAPSVVEERPSSRRSFRSERRAPPSPGPSRWRSRLESPYRGQADAAPEPSMVRPAAPTPGHAHRRPHRMGRHRAPPVEVDDAPFPQIRGARLERLFFSVEHNARTCSMCNKRRTRPGGALAEDGGRPLSPSWLPSQLGKVHGRRHHQHHEVHDDDEDEGFGEGSEDGRRGGKVPPQTVLAKVIKEMEEDFAHYKSVYVELADQYRIMDAASDVPKRNLIAQHLREVIDIIEQKGDHIATLYDLLEFKDKPL